MDANLCLSSRRVISDTLSGLLRSPHRPAASTSPIPMATACFEPKHHHYYQNIIVMRHGDRMDNFCESWIPNAARPWDPPLFEDGHARSLRTGQQLLTDLGYPIHRVFVSPFLRCVQTAAHVASALCAVRAKPDDVSSVDPSKIKTSIQYGLSEMFNNVAIRHPPKEGQEWGFNLSEIETELPASTVDRTCEQVNAELPQWGETTDDARARYERVIRTLADKYPSENLLLITHGEGLKATVKTFMKDVKIRKVEYCAYLQLRREMVHGNDPAEAGSFELLPDHSDGMTFTPLNDGV